MTTAEAQIYYLHAIRHVPRHGAYIPLPVLDEMRKHPDADTLYAAVFGVINFLNASLPDPPDSFFNEEDIDIEPLN